MNRCRQCEAPLDGLKSSARYCGQACRGAYRRAHPPTPTDSVTEVADQVRAQLDALALDDHPVRALALRLADALDAGAPPTALPGITRELVKLLERAEELGTEPEPDFVDQLRARVQTRRQGARATAGSE